MQKIDEIDRQILNVRSNEFNKKPAPRIGDFVQLKSGMLTRITYIYKNDDVQSVEVSKASFYLDGTNCQHSGFSGDIICKIKELKPTNKLQLGEVWFFHHGEVGPSRRVDFQINFNVFKIS